MTSGASPLDVINGKAQWSLIHGDCMGENGLSSLPPNSVGHCIADPPYSEVTHAGARSHKDVDSASITTFDSITAEQISQLFDSIGRVVKRWVVATVDWRHIFTLEQSPPARLRFVRFGIWVKVNSAPQFTGDRPATGWEGVAILHTLGGKMKWNGGGKHGVWNCPIEHGEHPTQKPLKLIETWVEQFTDPDDIIIDPMAGSGTTGAAALKHGRRFVGWERDEKYYQMALKRIDNEARQEKMAFSTPLLKEQKKWEF